MRDMIVCIVEEMEHFIKDQDIGWELLEMDGANLTVFMLMMEG